MSIEQLICYWLLKGERLPRALACFKVSFKLKFPQASFEKRKKSLLWVYFFGIDPFFCIFMSSTLAVKTTVESWFSERSGCESDRAGGLADCEARL